MPFIIDGGGGTPSPTPTPVPAPIATSQVDVYVDNTSTGVTTRTGNIAAPFLTIQEALNKIGKPTSSADSLRLMCVHVSSGNYTETLNVPEGRMIKIVCHGWVNFTGNINYLSDGNARLGSGIRSFLSISGIDNNLATSTHIGRQGGMLINGRIVRKGTSVTGITTHDLYLSNVQVTGGIGWDASIAQPGGTSVYLVRSRLQGTTSDQLNDASTGFPLVFQQVEDSKIEGTLKLSRFGGAVRTEFSSVAMTLLQAGGDIPPYGFFDCVWTGTNSITAPANSFKLNGVSFVNSAAVTLSGGVTRQRIEDFTPLATGATDNAVTRFDGTTGLLQTSGVTIDDTNNVKGAASVQLTGGTGTAGTLSWNDGDGTIDIALKGGQTVLQVGQEQVARVLNNTGAALSDGQVVYITGAQGQRPTVALADADIEATSSATIGIVTEPIANGAEGFVTLSGLVRNVDTSAWAEGAQLYVSGTAGALTTTKPVPPAHAVRIGWVVRQHATSGSILVHVQNGYELDELHDVLLSGLADKQILAYDAASGLWKNTANNPTSLTGPTSITANSTSAALVVTQDGAGNALEVRDATGDATPFMIDANGNVGVKISTGVTGAALSVAGDATSGILDGFRASNDSGGYALRMFKNRNANVYLNTSVQNGDLIGAIQCYGSDGTAYGMGAQIVSQVDGTPATGSVPARLLFSTTPASGTTPIERMRINSNGGVGIGAVADAPETLRLGKSLTGGTGVVQQWNVGQIQSDVTSGAYYYRTFANTVAANFTIAQIAHYDTVQGPFGAGSTVVSQIGFLAGGTLTGALSNYGFYGNIPAGANRWNFYAASTASNYFAGNVLIGTATDNGAKLQVTGSTKLDGDLDYTGVKSHWMGEVYMVGNATATVIASTANYVKAAGTTIIGNNMGFDNGGVSNRLRYTGAITRMFHVAVSFSFSAASNSQNVEFAVFKNGVRIDSSVQETKTGAAGDVQSTALHVVATLATNDYLEVFCRNLSTASNVTVKNLNFFAMNAN